MKRASFGQRIKKTIIALAAVSLVFVSLLNAGPVSADEHAAADEHGSGSAQHSEHGHHDPHFSDINWFTGLIGEKEGVEPSLLWRPVGTPVPLGALIINTAILFFLIGRFGGPAISAGLKSRKENIAGDMHRAAKMKEEAEEQLAEYEGRLTEMASEMDRIKKQMSEQAQNERERMLSEARQRAAGIEAEAKQMVEQQLSQARKEATQAVVEAAISTARAEIEKGLQPTDQDRLAQDLLASVESHFKTSEVRS